MTCTTPSDTASRDDALAYEQRLREVWGDNISTARKRKKWSQAELARRSGVHQSSIAKYEMRRTKPAEKHKVAIAKALGRNPAKLFPLELED